MKAALFLIQVFRIACGFSFVFFCLDQLCKMCAPIVIGCALQQSLIALDILVAGELVIGLVLYEIVHEALLVVAGGSARSLSRRRLGVAVVGDEEAYAHGFAEQALLPPDDSQLRSIKADVHDERSVADALDDAYGTVNAVSLYIEQGQETFHSVHVESAQRVAVQAQRAGVKRFVHVSGIGADARSPSLYIRKRGEGELAVREAFADAILIRPAVMFGSDDAFLTTILKLLERLLIYPMFGNGQMRLQPVYVEDVGDAIAKLLQRAQTRPFIFECGGPRVYSYEEILKAVASAAGVKPMLIRVPFTAWHALAWISEMLPSPPITRNQVELMKNRHHLSGGHTRNGGTWNLPTFDRGNTPGHTMGALTKKLKRGLEGCWSNAFRQTRT
jgi:uncharacterized protein YbjT (DUF2867 family)